MRQVNTSTSEDNGIAIMGEKLFNVGVKAVIRRGDKLIIMRNTKGFWEVPGGRMDGDETIEETLRRELNEELPNIKNVKVHELLDAVRLHKDIKENVSLVLIFYRVTASFEGEPQLSDEHDAYKWATRDEALGIVYDKYRDAIKHAFEPHA